MSNNNSHKFRACAIVGGNKKFIYFGIEEAGKLKWDILDEAPVFEQYTGAKDSRGRRIYEGDIVRYCIPWNKQIVTRIVKYDEKFLGFMLGDDTKSFIDLRDILVMKVPLIIGNIFQNPELILEVSKDSL